MKRTLWLALASVVVLAIFVFALYFRQPAGLGESRLKAAQSLALVCRMMAQEDASGVYPTTRREIDDFAHDLENVWNPAPGIEYLLRPGVTEMSPEDAIVIYSRDPIRNHQHYVALKDGSGKFVTREELDAALSSDPTSTED